MCLQSPLDWALYRLHILQTAEVPAGGDRKTITTLMLSQTKETEGDLQKDTVAERRSASVSLVHQISSYLCRSYSLRTPV